MSSLLTLLVSIIGIIATLLIIIGIHEFGHFLAARCLGVKVLRFSLGFGKAIWRKTDKTGTEYMIAAIPLGGYVKMLDEEESSVPKDQRHLTFNAQPFYKKFIIVAAGPVFNLILAFLLYWMLYIVGFVTIAPVIGKIAPNSIAFQAGLKPQQEIVSVDDIPTIGWMSVIVRLLSHTGEKGSLPISTKPLDASIINPYTLDLTNWHMDNLKPDPLDSLGIIPYEPNIPMIIGQVAPDSAAAKANLQVGDKITQLNGKPLHDWFDLTNMVDKNPSQKLTLSINRQGKIQNIDVTPSYRRDMLFKKHGVLGIAPEFQWPKGMLRKIQYGPVLAATHAWQNIRDFTYLNFIIIGKLFTGKASLQSLGGPISIFQSAGLALNQGIAPFMSFLAFLSISIGIINIFPIPGLDGGHILFQVIELIMRRPIPQRVLMLLYRVGIILLLLLVFQAITNDILRLQ